MSSGKRKKGGALKYILIILLLLMVLICTSMLFYVQNIGLAYKPDDKTYRQIEIPQGTPAAGVSNILEKNGVIKFSHEFSIYSRINRLSGKYQAGVYALSPSMTMDKIAKILSSGRINSVSVTIPEGYTADDIADVFADQGLIRRKKLKNAMRSESWKSRYKFLKKSNSGKYIVEGYLAPKTYEVPAGSSADDVVAMMLDGHYDLYNVDMQAKASRLKRTEKQIMIIASIIEKECGVKDDMPKVASVIYNRLKKKMALQMDSTVQYVLDMKGERKKEYEVSNQDTRIKSPYNTYINKGLPPGPICSPGKDAIEAAVNPANTKYLYFVQSEKLDDTMNFSVKYNRFLKDKDAYYAALSEQGLLE